jgi:hypothetical protein
LDRGEGNKDSVIAPELPTGVAVGHAIFDDEPHRHGDDPMGVVTAARRHVGQVDAEILVYKTNRMLRKQEVKHNDSCG